MDTEKYQAPDDEYNFTEKFKIYKFKNAPECVADRFLHTDSTIGVCICIQGKGMLPENYDYVTFQIRKFDAGHVSLPRVLVCTCTVNILDVNGEKKFPRTFEFRFRSDKLQNSFNDSEDPGVEEKYVERRSILNNEFEYLEDDALTVLVEVTLTGMESSWNEHDWNLAKRWLPIINAFSFQVKQLENVLEVYLRPSKHLTCLMHNSSVIQAMWFSPMRERKEMRLKLVNEELPALLCMLYFIETKKLILYETTIFDVYKIAHMYDIQIVLKKCRQCIEKYIPRNSSAILEFATYYNDIELMETTKSYLEMHPQETHGSNSHSDDGNELGEDFVCNTGPVSSDLIKAAEDFENYLINLWEKIEENSDEIMSFGEDPYNQTSETELHLESFNFYK